MLKSGQFHLRRIMDMYVHVRDYCTLVQGNDISFGVDCCLLLLKGSPEPQHGSNSIPRFFYAFKFHQILTKMKKFISALVLGCLLGFTFVSYALSAPSGVNARDRKSTRLNSSHANISYAVFCL